MPVPMNDKNENYESNTVRYIRQLIDFVVKRKHSFSIEQLDAASKIFGYNRPVLDPVKYCYMCKRQIVRHAVSNDKFTGGGPIQVSGSKEVLCKECENKVETL